MATYATYVSEPGTYVFHLIEAMQGDPYSLRENSFIRQLITLYRDPLSFTYFVYTDQVSKKYVQSWTTKAHKSVIRAGS
jgi:hypothetical protein